jgi:hypothetical protein
VSSPTPTVIEFFEKKGKPWATRCTELHIDTKFPRSMEPPPESGMKSLVPSWVSESARVKQVRRQESRVACAAKERLGALVEMYSSTFQGFAPLLSALISLHRSKYVCNLLLGRKTAITGEDSKVASASPDAAEGAEMVSKESEGKELLPLEGGCC